MLAKFCSSAAVESVLLSWFGWHALSSPRTVKAATGSSNLSFKICVICWASFAEVDLIVPDFNGATIGGVVALFWLYQTKGLGRRKAYASAAGGGLSVLELSPKDAKACSEVKALIDFIFIGNNDQGTV